MDSIIFLATAIGSSLAVVLLFSGTVLSIKWWKKGITVRHSTNKENEKGHSQRIRELGVRRVIGSKPRNQTFKKLESTMKTKQ